MHPSTPPVAAVAPAVRIVTRTSKSVMIACLVVGAMVGFVLGIFTVKAGRDAFLAMFRSERTADVSHPLVATRPAFRFEYPSNWKIDTQDADYDADHDFSVDSPGQSLAMFHVYDGVIDGITDPKAVAENMAKVQSEKLVKESTRTNFTTWGSFVGEGILLKGKHLGFLPGTLRIFAFRAGDRTIIVTEITYDEDRKRVQGGFDLIERSFRVTPSTVK